MKLTYRPEIDGLRAIAVVAVILYHAQITILGHQPFKGGFIGVDIFFVISGYLITSIILKELVTTGSFSFKHFYERRIRRILPALLFVMLVSLPFAWMYLLPSSFIDFSKSILYSLGFSSNFYFYYSGQVYGATSGLLKPFLHTWSLSVEEQYYILFPIVLLITFKYFRKYLIHILILGFAISLGLADWGNRNHPYFNFYFLPTRGWELLAGSILAYFEITNGKRSENKTLNLILPTIGFLLIGHSILFFKEELFHPSFYTLTPVIGVCLIIWYSNKNEIITKILSNKLFVRIGLISYSLYLWHYPIFAFSRITEFNQGNLFNKLLIGVIILILSIFSYYFVERPIRKQNVKFKVILNLIILFITIIIIINIKIILKKGYPEKYIFEKNRIDRQYYYNEYEVWETNYNYNNYDDRKNILIIGNSHGDDLLKILSITNLSKKIYFNTISPKKKYCNYDYQVSYFYDFLKDKKISIDYYCGISKDKIYGVKYGDFENHLLKQYNNSDLIIFSSRYYEQDLNKLDETIKILKQKGKKILIFDNALEQKINNRYLNRLDNFLLLNKKEPNVNELNILEKKSYLDLERKREVNLMIEQIANKNKVYLIKRENIFCDLEKNKCPLLTDEGYKIYWDYGHITNKGAEFFSKKIEKYEPFIEYINSTLHISPN